MSGLLLALALSLALVGESRYHPAWIELEGPLEGARVSVAAPGGEVTTRLAGRLLDGERRRLLVPLARRGPVRTSSPKVVFAGWQRVAGADPLAELPAGLRARPRPPVSAPPARLGPWVGWLVAGAFVLTLSARRKPALALGLGAGFAALLTAWVALRAGPAPPWNGARGPQGARAVLEGDLDRGAWLRVVGGVGELALVPDPSAELLVLEVRPGSAAVAWCVEFGSGPSVWRARARGSGRAGAPGSAILYALARFTPAGAPDPRGNAFAPLARTWTRGDGRWEERGAWPLGAPLPPSLGPAGQDPPGWLAAGLPQGMPVLLGRIEGPSPGPAWVRAVGP